MALAFADQWSNNNKNEEPRQEKLNQGPNEAMVGANWVNKFSAEGASGTAGGASVGNTGGGESAGSGEKKHGIGLASGAVTRNDSASGDGTTGSTASGAGGGTRNNIHIGMVMGMGGQSGAVEKATRAHRRRTKILSAVPFC
jgi:hypothetical protein